MSQAWARHWEGSIIRHPIGLQKDSVKNSDLQAAGSELCEELRAWLPVIPDKPLSPSVPSATEEEKAGTDLGGWGEASMPWWI